MASKVYTEEELNYFRICHIATNMLPKALRFLFKQEWDNRYKATLGEWKDSPQNGQDFKNGESPGNQRKNARLLATMVNGDRAQWDCTMLFYAILYSDSIAGHGLSPLIKINVDDLRKFRNEDYAHMTEGQFSNADFKITVAKVETAFRALGLSAVEIQTVSKQTTFPTDELQNVKTSNQKLTQDLQAKDAELQEKDSKFQEEKDKFEGKKAELQDMLKTTEEQRKVFEEQLQRKVEPFCVLPPRPPHLIASRDYHVDKVTQKLLNLRKANGNTLSYCYISGNPGSGKSQLGLAAEKYYKEASKDTTAPSFVMTLNAENPEALLTSYQSLARKMQCPECTINTTENSKDLNNERKIAIIKDLIAAKIHLYSSWLLVIDNVTNLSWIGQFLPERGNEHWSKGQLLITTQDCSCIPPDSSFTSHISISKGMEPADAICLLTELSGITDNDMGENVAHALDYQPLALASAGVYVRKVRNTNPDFGWKGYLEKLEKGKRELTEKELANVNLIYPNSMTIATRVAVEAVMDSDKIMKHAFTFFAFCATEPLRLDVLTTYVVNADEELDEEDIGIQIQGSSLLLIGKEDDSVNIRLHKVVHDIVKHLVKDQMEANEHARVACVAMRSFSQYIHEAIPEILQSEDSVCGSRHIVPHLKTLAVGITNIISTEEKFAVMKDTILNMYKSLYNFEMLGEVCCLHSEYVSAMKYLSVALKLIEDNTIRTGPDHGQFKQVARLYHNMGLLHRRLCDYQQAKRYYERALSIRLNKLGPDHADVAHTYHIMGTLHRHLGDYRQAKEYYLRALTIRLNKFRPDHVAVAHTCHHMGTLHRELGDHRQAKEYYLRALSIRLNKLGPDHVVVAYTYQHMGTLHRYLCDHQQAKEYYERALSIQLNKLGPDHVDVGRTYHSMGILHGDLGDHQQAKEYYERAMSIQLNKLGPDHVDVARTYHSMGILHGDLGDHQQAKEYYERALSIQLNKLGPDHVDVAGTYHNIGILHHHWNDFQQAKEYYERALSIRLNKLGPEHIDVAQTYQNMGTLHRHLDDFQQAKEYYEHAVSIKRNKLGPDHVDVTELLRLLADVQRVLDSQQQASDHHDRTQLNQSQ